MSGSGYDDNSRQAAQQLLARAQAGDQAAAMQLYKAASPGGWRPGHQNAAIDAYNELTPGTDKDLSHINASHGFMGDVGKGIGHGLHTLAPLAAFIPGIGPVAAGALAAGGSMLGSEMAGDGLDFGGALKSGVLAGVGNKLMGKGDAKMPAAPDGISAPGGPSIGMPSVAGGPGGSSAFTAPGGVDSTAAGAATAAAGRAAGQAASHGVLDQLKNQFVDPMSGKIDFSKLANIGVAGMDVMGKRSQRHAQEKYMNSELELRRGQIAQGQQAYAEKAPMRQQALARLAKINAGGQVFGGGY